MADLKIALEIFGEDKASGPIGHVVGSLGKLDESSTKSHGSINALSTYLAGPVVAAATAVAAGIGKAVGAAAEFDSTISAVKAVTGASAEDMATLSTLALQLGKDTSFSATEAAKGIGELAKGGVEVADIMGGAAASALNLAAAGGVSVADAASLAANAMSLFGLEGRDMGMVADQIAGFANATTGSVTDFKFALAASGAVAKLAGQDFDQTATAIGLMGKAGILGSDAGTSLKTMLNNLIPTTKKQSEMFNQLGLMTFNAERAMEVLRNYGVDPTGMSLGELNTELYKQVTGWSGVGLATKEQIKTWDEAQGELALMQNAFLDSNGNFKDLRDISEELNRVTKDLSESERSLALETIFGSDAIRAAAILADAGAEGFDNMAEAMGKVSAESVAATRLDNLAGSAEQLSGSFETASIMLGHAFTPILKEATDWGVKFLNDSVIPFVEDNGPALTQQLSEAGHAFGQLVEFLSPLVGVYGPYVRQTFDSWGEGIDATISNVVALGLGIKRMVADTGQFFDDTGTAIDGFIKGTGDAVGTGWNDMVSTVGGKQDELGKAIADGWTEVQRGTGEAVDNVKTTVAATWDEVRKNSQATWDLIPEDIRTDLGKIEAALGEKTETFIGQVAGWMNRTTTDVDTGMGKVNTSVATNFDAVGTKTNQTWDAFGTTISGAVKTAGDAIGPFANTAKETIGGAFDTIGTKTNETWGAFSTTISGKLTEAKTGFDTFATDITTKVSALAATVLTEAGKLGQNMVNGITAGITSAANGVGGALGDAVRGAIGVAKTELKIESPSEVTEKEIGSPMIDGVILAIQTGEGRLSDVFAKTIVAAVDDANDLLTGGGVTRWGGVGGWRTVLGVDDAEEAAAELGPAISRGMDRWGGVGGWRHVLGLDLVDDAVEEALDEVPSVMERSVSGWHLVNSWREGLDVDAAVAMAEDAGEEIGSGVRKGILARVAEGLGFDTDLGGLFTEVRPILQGLDDDVEILTGSLDDLQPVVFGTGEEMKWMGEKSEGAGVNLDSLSGKAGLGAVQLTGAGDSAKYMGKKIEEASDSATPKIQVLTDAVKANHVEFTLLTAAANQAAQAVATVGSGSNAGGSGTSHTPGGYNGPNTGSGATHAAHGGSWMVGGNGPTDSQMIGFAATPGELFEVTPPGRSGGDDRPIILEATFILDGEVIGRATRTFDRRFNRNNLADGVGGIS